MKTRLLMIIVTLALFGIFHATHFAEASPLWENRVDGMVRSLDITNNGTFIIAGTEIADKKGSVYLFDNSGTILWKKDLDRIIVDVSISNDGSLVLANGIQLSDGPGKFYMNPSMYLFDNSGNLLWQYQNLDKPSLGTENQFLFGTITPEKNVIIQADNEILYLDRFENMMWNYTANEVIDRVKTSPDGTIIAVGVTDYLKDNKWSLYVFDNDGNLLWKHIGSDGRMQSSALSISLHGDIAVGSMPSGEIGTLYLFDKTGNNLWKRDVPGGVLDVDISNARSVVAGSNNGIFLFDGNGTKIASDTKWFPNISSDGTVIVAYGQLDENTYGVTLFNGKLEKIWDEKIPDGNVVKISDNDSFVAVGTKSQNALGSFGQVFLMEGLKPKLDESKNYHKSLSPLKQFKSGIALQDIKCKPGLELVERKANGYPLCIKGTSVKTLTLRNFITEYVGSLGGEIPVEVSNGNQSKSIPLTLFPATPQTVRLPDTTKKDDPDTTLIPINKINQLTITNSDSTNGQKTHLAQISINGATLYRKDIENLPTKPGLDTVVFDYTIQSKDHDAFYALVNFELQFGSKKYPALLNGNEFSELLLPDEKRDSSFAMQVNNDAKQIILNIKDADTKKTLWVVPLDITNYKIKCTTGCLIQENEN